MAKIRISEQSTKGKSIFLWSFERKYLRNAVSNIQLFCQQSKFSSSECKKSLLYLCWVVRKFDNQSHFLRTFFTGAQTICLGILPQQPTSSLVSRGDVDSPPKPKIASNRDGSKRFISTPENWTDIPVLGGWISTVFCILISVFLSSTNNH